MLIIFTWVALEACIWIDDSNHYFPFEGLESQISQLHLDTDPWVLNQRASHICQARRRSGVSDDDDLDLDDDEDDDVPRRVSSRNSKNLDDDSDFDEEEEEDVGM